MWYIYHIPDDWFPAQSYHCPSVGEVTFENMDKSGRSLSTQHSANSTGSVLQIDGLVQDCSISIALALELLQTCTKSSECPLIKSFFETMIISIRRICVLLPIQSISNHSFQVNDNLVGVKIDTE